ncbi:hypothetical protein GIB67_020809 [Kingdonia uniflora]|uniref:Large ribosomal subunit protein uL15/eL18 domain-containing protein n=1 Tax=Kingdonia uniflora TaxID=39325 RepID=A0A7J7M786_9MAGN|nr:hypothetical protein GIB67_020809 [Kingdonia uniflora]
MIFSSSSSSSNVELVLFIILALNTKGSSKVNTSLFNLFGESMKACQSSLEGKIVVIVIIGAVTDDTKVDEVPLIKVVDLRLIETASTRIEKVKGKCLKFDHLLLRTRMELCPDPDLGLGVSERNPELPASVVVVLDAAAPVPDAAAVSVASNQNDEDKT